MFDLSLFTEDGWYLLNYHFRNIKSCLQVSFHVMILLEDSLKRQLKRREHEFAVLSAFEPYHTNHYNNNNDKSIEIEECHGDNKSNKQVS